MEARQQYTERLSREFPGLFVVLLDQSSSMDQAVAGESITKAEYATSAVNDLISTMCQEAGLDDSDRVKKLVYVSVLGYNDDCHALLTGPESSAPGDPVDIQYLSEHYLGTETVQRPEWDSESQEYRQIDKDVNYWIDPPSASGSTDMVKALREAKNIISRWLDTSSPRPPLETGQAARSRCFPPIVINISDAEHNGEGNPEEAADRIRELETEQGNCLIFTCHITRDRRKPCVFPQSVSELVGLHPTAVTMFNMSSILPEILRAKASRVTHGRPIPQGSRAFIYNANSFLLAEFLRWGTKGTVGGW